MSAENFDACVKIILEYEGGESNHPADPGGHTKYGISQTFHLDVDIANLTLDGAKEIYKREYWDRAGCDALSVPLDFAVFDAAVQHGPETAKQMCKKSSGMWENMIMQRMKKYVSWSRINKAARTNFFWGWMNRLYRVIETCEKWNAEEET